MRIFERCLCPDNVGLHWELTKLCQIKCSLLNHLHSQRWLSRIRRLWIWDVVNRPRPASWLVVLVERAQIDFVFSQKFTRTRVVSNLWRRFFGVEQLVVVLSVMTPLLRVMLLGETPRLASLTLCKEVRKRNLSTRDVFLSALQLLIGNILTISSLTNILVRATFQYVVSVAGRGTKEVHTMHFKLIL